MSTGNMVAAMLDVDDCHHGISIVTLVLWSCRLGTNIWAECTFLARRNFVLVT